MEDATDKQLKEIRRILVSKEETIDMLIWRVVALENKVNRLMHPYAPNDPRPAHIVNLDK